ncbi:MAG: hypothetical protein Q8Q06_02975 [bacterium]|nr:hypothetical protein [bacterium]
MNDIVLDITDKQEMAMFLGAISRNNDKNDKNDENTKNSKRKTLTKGFRKFSCLPAGRQDYGAGYFGGSVIS